MSWNTKDLIQGTIDLLNETAKKIESESDLSHITKGEKFEDYVVEVMREVAKKNPKLPQDIYHTGKQTFPDIVIEKSIGIEVKFSNSGKLESLGNSIFEGTSIDNLHEILVLFGKKNGKKIEIKYDLYQNCLSDVKVTHSPRFIISLEPDRNLLFKELDITYNEFRELDKLEKGRQIKNYFRKNLQKGEEVWFLDNEESSTSVKITPFSNLSSGKQVKLLAEAFILFPEVFSKPGRRKDANTKYAGVATYWITKYQVYNSALRDKFSASGQIEIFLPEKGHVKVKRIYENLYNFAPVIRDYFSNADDEFIILCKDKWEHLTNSFIHVNKQNLQDTWVELINRFGEKPDAEESGNILPSDIFFAGLDKK